MTNWIYRVDFTGLDAAGASTDFSYATRGYTAPATHPTKAGEWFDARLAQPLLLRRDLYGHRKLLGDVEIAPGAVELLNGDGGLDSLMAYGFDAQSIEIWKIDPDDLGTDLLEFRGVMEQLMLNASTVTITVRDQTYVFDRALQPTKFLGNNALPNGLEGGGELKGRPKPILMGQVHNFEPVLVNTSRLVYQFHDKAAPGTLSVAVQVRRVPLSAGISRTISEMQSGSTPATVSSIDTATDTITFTANHGWGFTEYPPVHVASTDALPAGLADSQYYYARADLFDLKKATLHTDLAGAVGNFNKVNITSAGSGTITVAKNRTPFGSYDWCDDAAGCFLRLGSTPSGRVTATATIGANGTTAYTWDLLVADIANRVGTFSVDVRIADPTALVDVSHYWTGEMTAYGAIREVLRGVNASYQVYPNRGGSSPVYLSLQRLTSPAAPERLELNEGNIIAGSLQRVVSTSAQRGIPPWRILVPHYWNPTVLTATDTDSSVLSDAVALTKSYRSVVTREDATVKLKYPAAPELTLESHILNGNDADDLALYLLDVYSGTDRGMYQVRVHLSVLDSLLDSTGGLSLPGLLLNDVVKLTFPRFGFDSGKYLAVVGYVLDIRDQTAELTLWG